MDDANYYQFNMGSAMGQKLPDIWVTTWFRNVTSRGGCSTCKLRSEIYGMEDYLVKL